MEFLQQNAALVSLATFVCIIFIFFVINSAKAPYQPVAALLTKAEQNFYLQLLRVVPDGMIVFSKVRIADVVDVSASVKGKARLKHFNPIAAKHFDFVLVDKNFHILGAIELNDSSHDKDDRKKRDEFVRSVMKSAKLPLFEVKATRKYKLDALKRELLLLVGGVPFVDNSTPEHQDTVKQTQLSDESPLDDNSENELSEAQNYPVDLINQDVRSPIVDDAYVPPPLASFMDENDLKNLDDSSINSPLKV